MDELTFNHIHELPKKEQQKFHQYVNRRLRKIHREIRNQTENAIDRKEVR